MGPDACDMPKISILDEPSSSVEISCEAPYSPILYHHPSVYPNVSVVEPVIPIDRPGAPRDNVYRQDLESEMVLSQDMTSDQLNDFSEKERMSGTLEERIHE